MKIRTPRSDRAQVADWREDPQPGWYIYVDRDDDNLTFLIRFHEVVGRDLIVSCYSGVDGKTACDRGPFPIPLAWPNCGVYHIKTPKEIAWAAQLRILQK